MNELSRRHLGLFGHLELWNHWKRRRACRIARNVAKTWFYVLLAKVVVLAVNFMAVPVFRSVEARWPNPLVPLHPESPHQNHLLKVGLPVPAVKELHLWLLKK
jgi:hypothetical protein